MHNCQHKLQKDEELMTSAPEKYTVSKKLKQTYCIRNDLNQLSRRSLFRLPISFSSMFIIKTLPLYPAYRRRKALNKHLEHYIDYVKSINCSKWDKVDKKCNNL